MMACSSDTSAPLGRAANGLWRSAPGEVLTLGQIDADRSDGGVRLRRAAPRCDDPATAGAMLQTGTILVLDDDDLALDLMVRVVAAAFPECTVAAHSDVAEAMALCEAGPIDCLMIDYDMPAVDGLTAARYLRTRHPDLPIILFTGVDDGGLAWEAIQAGLNGYIPKHRVSSDLLRRTVSSAVSLARKQPAAGRHNTPPDGERGAMPGR